MDQVIQFEGTIYENGYGLLAQKAMRDKKLPPKSRLIYAYMCSFAGIKKDGERTAFPSVSLQCEELDMSENTYYKWRKELEKAGYIKITRKRTEGSKFDKNIYSIIAVPEPVEEEKKEENGEEKPYLNNYGTDKKATNQGSEPYLNYSGTENSSTENSSTENKGTNINSSTINSFNNNDLDTKDTKQAKREELLKKAFYSNEDVIPEEIASVLDIFSNNTDQANEYYKIILTAKKKAAEDLDMPIFFEMDEELTEGVKNAFVRSIRIIEKNRNTENPKGYIFKSVYGYITSLYRKRNRLLKIQEFEEVFDNWGQG